MKKKCSEINLTLNASSVFRGRDSSVKNVWLFLLIVSWKIKVVIKGILLRKKLRGLDRVQSKIILKKDYKFKHVMEDGWKLFLGEGKNSVTQ